MNRLFRRFWPPFLEKIDHWLLVNYPNLWATRIHGLLLAVGGLATLIGLKVLITSHQQVPNAEVDFGIIILVSGLIWLGWMISMYAFRPGKYPNTSGNGWKYNLTLILGTFLVASMPVIYGYGIPAKLQQDHRFSFYQEESTLEYGGMYWTYDNNSFEQSLDAVKRNRNSSSFAKGQFEQEKLESAMRLMEKYGGDFKGVTSQQLLDAHLQTIAMPSSFKYDVEKAHQNLQHKRDAEFLIDIFYELPAFKSELTHIILFIFLLIGLLTLVFQHASMRQFVWAVIAFGAIFLAIGLLMFANDISNSFRDDNLLSSLIVGSYLLAGGIAAFGGRFKNLRRTAVLLLALAMPFAALAIGFLGDEVFGFNIRHDWGLTERYEPPFWMGVVPAVGSLVLWVTVFIPQLQKLQSTPTRK